jgi:hypothetical protein
VAGGLGLEILTPVPLWGIAGARGTGTAADVGPVPALRTDLGTLGVERWLGGGWLATANAYHRRSAGVLVDDPTPGVVDGSSPLFVVGGERATGVEVGVRRLVGRVTLAGNYALARARVRAAGLAYAPPQDQRHVGSATAMWRAGSGLRVAAAYTAFSGAPFTRGRARRARRVRQRGDRDRPQHVPGGARQQRVRARLPRGAGRRPLPALRAHGRARRLVGAREAGARGRLPAGAQRPLPPHQPALSRLHRVRADPRAPPAAVATRCSRAFPILPTLGLRLSF